MRERELELTEITPFLYRSPHDLVRIVEGKK